MKYLFPAPVSSPREVSVDSLSSTSFALGWLPPVADDVNGLITGYIVSVYVNDTHDSYYYNVTDTNITLYDLHPYYTYKCSVSCVTVASGPFSTALTVRTLQAGEYHVYAVHE